MAVISGLGSSWSLAKETTYGTLATPTRAVPIISEDMKLNFENVVSKTLKGGNRILQSNSWRRGGKTGGGPVQTLLWQSGATLLWEAMLGTNATTGAGPYTHTASLADPLPSYSIDVTLGGTAAGNLRKTVLGAKVDTWQLKAALKNPVTLGQSWVYQSETLAAGAIRGTIPTGQKPYSFTDVAISGGASLTGCVEDITINGNNNLIKDQFCLGQSSINEPVRNGFVDISGSMSVILDGTATNYGLYTAGNELSLVLTLTGTSPATTTITMNVRIDGSTPTANTDGELKATVPFTCLASTTDASAFTVVTVNSDSTA